jgi:hypothetical protein
MNGVHLAKVISATHGEGVRIASARMQLASQLSEGLIEAGDDAPDERERVA